MILAIETGAAVCGASLDTGNGFISRVVQGPNQHSEKLASSVKEIFTQAGIRAADLSGIIVSGGPGSFTGLRIGMSFAKGLALPSATPMAVIPTMESLAWKFRREAQSCARPICMIRSHKDNVFSADLRNFPDQPLDLRYSTLEEACRDFGDCDGMVTNDRELGMGIKSVFYSPLDAEMLLHCFRDRGRWLLDPDHDKAQILYGLEYKAKKWLS